MRQILQNWLLQTAKGRLLDAGEVNEVANYNLRCFKTTLKEANLLKTEEIEAFVLATFEIYRQKLDHAVQKMCFYAWFDEFAGQLRCSAAPANNPKELPFGCTLEIVETPRTVAEQFLTSSWLESIPLDEPDETPSDLVDESSEGDFTLTVFARMLS